MNRIASILGAIALSNPAIAEVNPGDYALKIEYSVPTISGIPQEGFGTGFIIDRVRGIVMTAAHVIPAILPGLKDGSLMVEGKPAKLICFDGEHDLAVLQVSKLPSSKKPPKITNYSPKIGDKYVSTLNNDKGMSYEIQHNQSGEYLQIPMTLTSYGIITSVSNAVKMKTSGEQVPTKTEILITDKPSKPGFSGGPAIDIQGNLIGVQIRVDTSFGVLSSVKNVNELLSRKACQAR